MSDVFDNGDSALNTGARDELRLRVLRALEANPQLSQRKLAAELGVSLGYVTGGGLFARNLREWLLVA